MKETVQNHPAFANQAPTNQNPDQIKLTGGTKQVWGASAPPTGAQPATTGSSSFTPSAPSTPATSVLNKKPEPPKPVVDEKKEQMKNALFSGISSAKKDDSSDSDDDKKQPPKAEPANEINLLDMDSGQPDLLGGTTTATAAPATSGNLLDDMFATGTSQS